MQATSLSELAAKLNCRLIGDGAKSITGVAGMEQATFSQLTFLANPKYAPKVKDTRAGAILLPEPIPGLKIRSEERRVGKECRL